MIGSGKLQGGLYYSETKALRKPSLTSYTWNQLLTHQSVHQLHQWHQQLGHPSFGILEKLFPDLTKRCNPVDFFLIYVNWQIIRDVLAQ